MPRQSIRTPSGGNTIAATLHLPAGEDAPCVVVSHGLYSSKDSPKLTALAEFFAARGMAVLRYDHSGCGQSSGSMAHTTVASRLAELCCMIDLVAAHPRLGGNVGLLGSSMGGFISLFQAQRDPRVRATVLWSTPAFLRHPERDAPPGSAPEQAAFLADAGAYDARRTAAGPDRCLIVHGAKDHLVPPFHAEIIYQRARCPKQLQVLDAADHRFSAMSIRQQAFELSWDWLREHL